MNGSRSDGCASGCSGCLLVILAAALVAAGPPGWALGLGVLVILVLIGSQGNARPRPLPNPRRRGAALREAALLEAAHLEAGRRQRDPAAASDQLPASSSQPNRSSAAASAGDDPELDRLMEEARRALDEAL